MIPRSEMAEKGIGPLIKLKMNTAVGALKR